MIEEWAHQNESGEKVPNTDENVGLCAQVCYDTLQVSRQLYSLRFREIYSGDTLGAA